MRHRNLDFEFIKGLVMIFGILYITYFTVGVRVIDGFSTKEHLIEDCIIDSKEKYRIGAICEDGWKSNATGRGACSHHNGVKEWRYKYRKTKSLYECKEWAKQRSWID